MKRNLPYKTDKWEKTKQDLIEDNRLYSHLEIPQLEKLYQDGEIGEVRFCRVLARHYTILAQEEFAQHHFSECRKMIEASLNEFIIAINKAQENTDDDFDIRDEIKLARNSIENGCYAILLDRYDDIPIVTAPETNFYKVIVEKKVIDVSKLARFDEYDELLSALSMKDSVKFEDALRNEIKELRKNPVDFGVCADFAAMALIKEALKAGMTFYKDYVEVDFEE